MRTPTRPVVAARGALVTAVANARGGTQWDCNRQSSLACTPRPNFNLRLVYHLFSACFARSRSDFHDLSTHRIICSDKESDWTAAFVASTRSLDLELARGCLV